MPKTALYLLVAVLIAVVAVGATYAYQAHERDKNTLKIEVGPKGLTVDPPSR